MMRIGEVPKSGPNYVIIQGCFACAAYVHDVY